MMRICPQCGAYYADGSSAFCLADGRPLINVDPGSEHWSEGARVIEEKQNALRKHKRKLKWRRVLMTATTMLIATVVVCVVAVNGVIYLKPEWLPSPSPSPTPTPTPTPTLTNDVNPDANVQANANVKVNVNTHANIHANVNTNANTHVIVNTNANVNTEVKCSEEEAIKRIVHGNLEGHPPKTGPDGLPVRDAKITLGHVEYQIRFFNECKGASGTTRSTWDLKANATTRGGTVHREDTFLCSKIIGKWVCPLRRLSHSASP